MSRILIVSADHAVLARIAGALSQDERQLATAESPGAAIAAVGNGETDIVVAEADGADPELETLLAECRSGDLPVLLLGGASATNPLKPSDVGAQEWLTLPVADTDISHRVAALERIKRRFDQLRSQAVIDELTNSYNRRYMDEQLSVRLGEAKRYDLPFSFILFDLDHFKRVNDTHGDPFGDFVLRQMADLVRQLIRKEDVLTRYGGEEFAVISPHTDRLGSAILAERVREAVAERVFERDRESVQVTISLGVASYPLDHVDSAEGMLEAADKRLYEAKGAGRNQTVFE